MWTGRSRTSPLIAAGCEPRVHFRAIVSVARGDTVGHTIFSNGPGSGGVVPA
jgi:hypothetical protein